MMKKFVKGLTVYSCLAFALFNEDCIGMNIKQKSGTEIFSNSNSITTLQPLKKRPKVTVSQIESEDFSDSSVVSDTGSDSSTSSEEWISDRTELIQKACCEESSFDLLIDEIIEFSHSVEDRKKLYEEIENTWNEKNIFGATVLDDGSFAVFNAEHFD